MPTFETVPLQIDDHLLWHYDQQVTWVVVYYPAGEPVCEVCGAELTEGD